jgi:DNA-binding winged helix-turn-helix (wHTH) protein
VVQFGSFVFDPSTRQLTQHHKPVHITSKAIDLLILLSSRSPQAVSKKEIHQHLWPHTFVSEMSLTTLVYELRASLGESARRQRHVRTVHGYGYVFRAES